MAGFESPIGKRQIQSSGMKEFTVPDETVPPPPQRQARTYEASAPIFDDAEMRDFQARMQQPQQQVQMREIGETERQIMEAKRLKREGKERLSEGARRRVEMLINMSRMTRDVVIEGNLYRLQSLASKELREVMIATAEFDGSVQMVFENRKQILARSLIVVAGVDFGQFLNSTDIKDRIDIIEELDHALLVRLFNEYVILAQEVQDKYTLKTEQEVQEVLEDLKK